MAESSRDEIVKHIVKQHMALRAAHLKDPRYDIEAYRFVCEAVDYTCQRLDGRRDVSGRELLDGICDLALDHFGYLARTVLGHWGVTRTDHFGDIVFTLVDVGLLGRNAKDSKADFHDVFPLDQALDERFRIDLDAPTVAPHQETTE